MVKNEIQNRVLGAVFGEAIGDALGHPIEFRKTHVVTDLQIPDNTFTDDTQMYCAIGEALLEAPPHLNENDFMESLSKKFIEWRNNPLGGSHRGPGNNCMTAVQRLGAYYLQEKKGATLLHRPWMASGGLDFKGNGTAMRSGVIGAYYWKNPEYAFRIGGLSSVPTHNNLEAILGAATMAYLVATGVAGMNAAESIANALLLCGRWQDKGLVPSYPEKVKLGDKWENQSPWFAIAMWGAGHALANSSLSIKEALGRLVEHGGIGDGAVVPAVAEAIYFSSNFQIYHTYKHRVLEAVNNSRDTDTIGAMTGTILGSRLGLDKIPDIWVQGVEMSDYLRGLGDRIYEASENYQVSNAPADALDLDVFDTGF